MTNQTLQLPKVGKTQKKRRLSPNSHKYKDVRTREYLLPEEVEVMLSVTKKSLSRHAHRNCTLIGVARANGQKTTLDV